MEHRIFNCGPAARGTPAENSKYGAVYTILDKEISSQPLADREGARDTVHDRWLLKVSTDIEVTTKSNNVSPNAHSTFAQMSWIFSLAWEVSYPSKTCNSNHTAEVFMVLDFLKEYIAFDVFLRKTLIIIRQLTAIFQELNNQNTCTASFSWLKAHKC